MAVYLSGTHSGPGNSMSRTGLTTSTCTTTACEHCISTEYLELAGAYRFGFNGKERDDEMYDGGSIYDYGFRIYDAQKGRFFSVDPLTKSYPMLTSYQFASNSPIDGIDIDGLEFLSSKESRIQITNGLVVLKVANFNVSSIPMKNLDTRNWSNGAIGVNTIVAGAFTVIKQPSEATLNDIPLENMPQSAKGQAETGAKTQAYNRGGRSEIARGKGIVKVGPGIGGKAKVPAIIEVAMFGVDVAAATASFFDQKALEDHSALVGTVVEMVNKALADGKIPPQYQTVEALSDIMNVVLQGESKLGDAKIYELGMQIYNQYKPEPAKQMVIQPSGLDNYGDNVQFIPSPSTLTPADKGNEKKNDSLNLSNGGGAKQN